MSAIVCGKLLPTYAGWHTGYIHHFSRVLRLHNRSHMFLWDNDVTVWRGNNNACICLGSFKHTQSLCKTYLAQITSKSEHNSVMGHFNSISNMGLIVGPIIGSHVVTADGGFVQVACVTAVCFLLLFGKCTPSSLLAIF